MWKFNPVLHVKYEGVVCFDLLLILCLFFLLYGSLKQSGIHTGNPWPPYKERTPLHPCYNGLIKLLHCKTLHIVIFTLLYKVTLSTTVYCMSCNSVLSLHINILTEIDWKQFYFIRIACII